MLRSQSALPGTTNELVLEFAGSLEGVNHVWAQDLLGDGSDGHQGSSDNSRGTRLCLREN